MGDGLLLMRIKWSKTIQFAERSLEMPVVAIPGSPICPVMAYQKMLKAIKADLKSPAFCLKRKRTLDPLLYRKFQSQLREWISAAGWDPKLFSSHSLRRGGASLAFRAKVPTELIKVQGDWASDCYLKYLAIPLGQRIQVASQVSELVRLHSK